MNTIEKDLEKILGALATSFASDGNTSAVAVLALGSASTKQTDHDNWNGGNDGYTVYIQIPHHLYSQIKDKVKELEISFRQCFDKIGRLYDRESIVAFVITPELIEDPDWREKSKNWLAGVGVNNQGRVRSDNIACRSCDGLLFRSQPEIHLYEALKTIGIVFAPLPVFLRGGETYRRIEPDFILFKDGIFMVVEVDGDTVHNESPRAAHERLTMLVHEGAHVERIDASACATPEKARTCAQRLSAVLDKLKRHR